MTNKGFSGLLKLTWKYAVLSRRQHESADPVPTCVWGRPTGYPTARQNRPKLRQVSALNKRGRKIASRGSTITAVNKCPTEISISLCKILYDLHISHTLLPPSWIAHAATTERLFTDRALALKAVTAACMLWLVMVRSQHGVQCPPYERLSRSKTLISLRFNVTPAVTVDPCRSSMSSALGKVQTTKRKPDQYRQTLSESWTIETCSQVASVIQKLDQCSHVSFCWRQDKNKLTVDYLNTFR